MKQHNLKKIGFAGETIKLLGVGNEQVADNDYFSQINREANEERLNSIIYPTSTELIKIDPTKAVAQYVEAGELCTEDEVRKIALWSQKEEMRRHKQKLLNDAYTRERMRADEEELNKVLFDNIENLYEVIFSADMVFMCIEDEKAKCFGPRLDLPHSRYLMPAFLSHHILNNISQTIISISLEICVTLQTVSSVIARTQLIFS